MVSTVFICPISLEPMVDPVTLYTGQTYERANISGWLALGHRTCPTTMQELWDDALTPNATLRQLIAAMTVDKQPGDLSFQRQPRAVVLAPKHQRALAAVILVAGCRPRATGAIPPSGTHRAGMRRAHHERHNQRQERGRQRQLARVSAEAQVRSEHDSDSWDSHTSNPEPGAWDHSVSAGGGSLACPYRRRCRVHRHRRRLSRPQRGQRQPFSQPNKLWPSPLHPARCPHALACQQSSLLQGQVVAGERLRLR